jgi:hypothetical protein
MPLMQTANFEVARHLPNAVAISIGLPRAWRGLRYLALAPPWWLLKAARKPGGHAVFDEHFTEQLSHLDPKIVFHELEVLASDPVLLCWEDFNVRCHRRCVAEWLEAALGIEIPDLGPVQQRPSRVAYGRYGLKVNDDR